MGKRHNFVFEACGETAPRKMHRSAQLTVRLGFTFSHTLPQDEAHLVKEVRVIAK